MFRNENKKSLQKVSLGVKIKFSLRDFKVNKEKSSMIKI